MSDKFTLQPTCSNCGADISKQYDRSLLMKMGDSVNLTCSQCGTKWRFWMSVNTHEKKLDLNERQEKAIEYVKKNERISNSEYRELNNVPRKTVKRDISELVEKGILKQRGEGRSAHYTFPEK